MTRLNLWIPRLIVIIAVLHIGVAFVQPNTWADIAADGFFRANVDTDATHYDARESSIWFLATGIALLGVGALARSVVRATGRVPAQLGWYLMLLGVPLSMIYFPVAASWSLVVVGVLAVFAARRGNRGGDAARADAGRFAGTSAPARR